MKRTKRYGGFLIGDRVRSKHDINIGEGEVVGMQNGYLIVRFIVLGNGVFTAVFMPHNLINLTREEEERIKEIQEEIPSINEPLTTKIMSEPLKIPIECTFSEDRLKGALEFVADLQKKYDDLENECMRLYELVANIQNGVYPQQIMFDNQYLSEVVDYLMNLKNESV